MYYTQIDFTFYFYSLTVTNPFFFQALFSPNSIAMTVALLKHSNTDSKICSEL